MRGKGIILKKVLVMILIFVLMTSIVPSGIVAVQEGSDDDGSRNRTDDVVPSPTPTLAGAGLVAYFPFEGDIVDQSGNGNNGTNHNATFVAGYSGQGLCFDGVDDYVSAPVNINPDVMPQMTMIAWARSNSDSEGTVISCDDGGFDRTIKIDSRGGGTGWSAFCGSNGVLGYSPVTIGDWFFLAAIYDQNAETVKLYVNGTLINEGEGKLEAGWNYTHIGASPSFGSYFNGTIDEIRIYNYALSADDIKALYEGKEPSAPIQTPEPTSGEEVIPFEEDFDDGYAQEFGNEVGDWEVQLLDPKDGKYTATTGAYRFSTAGNPNWQDYVIEADFINAKDGGFLVRAQDHNNGIVLIVRPTINDIYWQVRKNGIWGVIYGDTTLGHEVGENLHVTVEVSGNEFKAYVNDELKTAFNTTECPKGKVGLYLFHQSDQYWDNVIVRSLAAVTQDFTIDISAPTMETSVGGCITYDVELKNRQKTADRFHIHVTGIDPAWFSIDSSCMLTAGEEKELPLTLSIPKDATGGEFTVLVNATSSNLGLTKAASKPLRVSLEPLISDLSPANGTHTGSSDVLISWKTSVECSSEVFIKPEGVADYTTVTGDPGVSHFVSVTNLTRNTWYQFYVRSQTDQYSAESEVRRIFIDNGIAFSKRTYEFGIERDYDQRVTIAVKNTDNEPHELLLSVSNVPEDLVVGFVGEGSMDQVISLHPGEGKDVLLVIHAPDAISEDYSLLLDLTNLGKDELHDYAYLKLHVHFPVINFTIEEISSDPSTLAKVIRVENHGDTITDFTIEADENQRAFLSFQPSIAHANLGRNKIIEFSVSPILSKYSYEMEAAVLEGEIIASGGGGAVELPVSFAIPAGWGIYYGDPPGIAATIWNKVKNWFCTNKPCVDTEVSIDPNVNGGSLTEEQIKTVLVTLAEGIATAPDPTSLTGIGISLIKTADVNTCAGIIIWCNVQAKKALNYPVDWEKADFWIEMRDAWSKRTPKPKMKTLGTVETQSVDPISIIPDGEVYVKIDTEWEPCGVREIETGEIKTEANSRAFLVCGGPTAEIRELSHLMIVRSIDTPTFYQEVEIFNGSARWHVLWGDFKASTPDAVLSVTNVDAFDNTDAAFDVEIIEDSTIIEVYRGSIDLTRRGNATASHVSRGYRATVSDEGIEIAEFELPRRTHIEGIPNIEEVKLIIDFSLPWDRRTYRNHDVDILINDNLVGQIKNSIPEGQYIFEVDPSYLNYGENETAKNIITLDTKHLNGGHYVVNAGMELLFRCTSLEIPIIASSQNEADRLSKELEYINWDGADLAVYTNSITLSNPSPVQGEAVTINATVYNIGVPPLSDVEVKFYDNGVEIGSKIIPYIYSRETIGIVWNTASGWHNLSIKVNPDRVIEEIDYTNNEASKTISVTGPDTTPPIISNPQPPDGSTTSDNMTLISADLADADSGVNTNAVRLVVDGTDVTQSANAISSCIWYTPEHALTAGVHNVSVYAADNEGNQNSLNWSFTVQTGIASYDLNGDSIIDKEEALKAVSDYLVYNKISKDLAIEVVKAYLLNPGVVFALAEGTSMREVSNSNPDPGEVVTVAIKSPEIGGFYAVKEDIDGLEYMGKHTADSKELEEMIFIMLQAKGFNYTVKVPEAAKPGDEFVITGKFWNDPAAKKEIGKTVLKVAPPLGMAISREVSSEEPSPGEVVTVSLEPSEIETFYAVKEDIDGLEYMGEHTADSKEQEEMIFIMLQAKGFNYTVKVPDAAKPGDEFIITGKFWNDPAAKKEIGKTVLKVADASQIN